MTPAPTHYQWPALDGDEFTDSLVVIRQTGANHQATMRASRFDAGRLARRARQLDKNRRLSVPARLRDAFPGINVLCKVMRIVLLDDVLHVLRVNGLCDELDRAYVGSTLPLYALHHHIVQDTGCDFHAAAARVNRPESVLQLARQFSATRLAQEKKAISNPPTPVHPASHRESHSHTGSCVTLVH